MAQLAIWWADPLQTLSQVLVLTLRFSLALSLTIIEKDHVLESVSHPVAIQDLGCSNNTGTSCVTKFPSFPTNGALELRSRFSSELRHYHVCSKEGQREAGARENLDTLVNFIVNNKMTVTVQLFCKRVQ